MNYIHTPFHYGGHSALPVDHHMGYGMPVGYHPFESPMDPYFIPYHHEDFPGIYTATGMIEEYDEYVESLSRPRLTKDQVETLEAQFQAHPKPNSNTKRQLALQTNLTLPRVANWFQNRRAKAKQQKRQEEFEKMQLKEQQQQKPTSQEGDKESAPPEQEQEQHQPQPGNSSDSPLTSIANHTSPTIDQPESSHKHKSQPTLLSCQSESNSNVRKPGHGAPAAKPPVLESKDTKRQDVCFQGLGPTLLPKPASSSTNLTPWSTASVPNVDVKTTTINEVPPMPTPHPAVGLEPAEYWPSASYSELMCSNLQTAHSGATELVVSTFPQPFLPLALPLYSSQDFSTSQPCSFQLDHAEITTNASLRPQSRVQAEEASAIPQIASPAGNPFPRHIEQGIGLAARRKRPRPAAIGTAGLNSALAGPPLVSPIRGGSGWNASHTTRKNSQNLHPDLSPRYAGVRKIAASPRSPLLCSMESTRHALSSAELMAPPLTTTSIPPPTPLTPDDMQYLVPPTPVDGQYCVSPGEDMSYSQLLSSTQATHFGQKMDSKSSSDMLGFPYPLSSGNYSQPFSAPPEFTTFDEFAIQAPIDPVVPNCTQDLSPISPVENAPLPVIHMPKPTQISPIAYEIQVGDTLIEDRWQAQYSSPQFSTNDSASPSSVPTPSPSFSAPTITEFQIQEFPQQEEALKFAAQQLPQLRARTYTFTNHTPNDF
ncbi:hypothetical protein FQN57_003989 [Myotisia sp. PD_48]|nr:hypothetical protein FQN57_003989 [Myotisia sp. PD_48]